MENKNYYITTTTIPVATKLGRLGLYNEELSSLNNTILWSSGLAKSSEILDLFYIWNKKAYGHQIWQTDLLFEVSTQNVTQPLEKGLTWGPTMNWKHYLQYHNVCNHQTWQGCYIQWGISPVKSKDPLITWSFKVTWQIKYVISLLPQWL